MAPGAEEVSFKRVTQGEGKAKKHYFIMCTLHEDEEDFEKSSLDLAVTSEHNCWQAQGLKKPKTPHAEALRRIHMALSPEQDSATAFKVQLTEKGENLQLICAWKDEGKEVFQRHQPFELARDEDESTATHVFDTLLAKCESLQAASKQGTGRLDEFKAIAEDSQKLVQKFVDSHGQREEEMYLKFAAVLNEKKKRIRELEKEIAALKRSSGKGNSAGPSKEASPGSSAKTEEDAGIDTDAEEADDDDQRTEDEGPETDAEESDEENKASDQEHQIKPRKKRKNKK